MCGLAGDPEDSNGLQRGSVGGTYTSTRYVAWNSEMGCWNGIRGDTQNTNLGWETRVEFKAGCGSGSLGDTQNGI